MTSQLAHFAIHADDLERARKFYGAIFGWKFQGYGGDMTDFCQTIDAAGNVLAPLGAIQARKFNSAPQLVIGFECSIAVDDIDAPRKSTGAHHFSRARPLLTWNR